MSGTNGGAQPKARLNSGEGLQTREGGGGLRQALSLLKGKGEAKAPFCSGFSSVLLYIRRLALGAELACVPGIAAGDISLLMGFSRDKRRCWHGPLGFFSQDKSVAGQVPGLWPAIWVLI